MSRHSSQVSLEADVVPLVEVLGERKVVTLLGHLTHHGGGTLRLHAGGVVEAGVGQADPTALGRPGNQLLPALVGLSDHLLGKLLVFRLSVESELVGRLPIGHLVDLKPLNCCLKGKYL